MATENSRKRRRYGAELKAQILAECDEPGASVAKVAMAHGINANIVHGWRKLAREARPAAVTEQFVPLAVAPAVPRPVDVRAIEAKLRRGAIAVKLSWPMSAALDLSAWMRELLRWSVPMIKVQAIWMAVKPLNMRSGTEAALAPVVTVFDAAGAEDLRRVV